MVSQVTLLGTGSAVGVLVWFKLSLFVTDMVSEVLSFVSKGALSALSLLAAGFLLGDFLTAFFLGMVACCYRMKWWQAEENISKWKIMSFAEKSEWLCKNTTQLKNQTVTDNCWLEQMNNLKVICCETQFVVKHSWIVWNTNEQFLSYFSETHFIAKHSWNCLEHKWTISESFLVKHTLLSNTVEVGWNTNEQFICQSWWDTLCCQTQLKLFGTQMNNLSVILCQTHFVVKHSCQWHCRHVWLSLCNCVWSSDPLCWTHIEVCTKCECLLWEVNPTLVSQKWNILCNQWISNTVCCRTHFNWSVNGLHSCWNTVG